MEPTRAMAPQGGYCSRRHGEKVDTHPPPSFTEAFGWGEGCFSPESAELTLTTPFEVSANENEA